MGLPRNENSGSPVSRAGRRVGLAARDFPGSDPEETTYGSGTLVSIDAIRTRLARRGLDRLLAR